MSFFSSTNIHFTTWEQFLQFEACKYVEIDAIGIKVAQQIKLSGCLTKGHFTDKSGKNAFSTVKWPLVGQPDNSICWASSTDLHALICRNCSQIVNWILVELENDIFFGFWLLIIGVFKKLPWLSYKISFISALWMVSSESWKRLHLN